MLKNNRIARSFIIQVADLVFHIEPNILTVSDGVTAVHTEVSSDVTIEIGMDGTHYPRLTEYFSCSRLETDSEFQTRVGKKTEEEKEAEIQKLISAKNKQDKEYKKYLQLRTKFEKPNV